MSMMIQFVKVYNGNVVFVSISLHFSYTANQMDLIATTVFKDSQTDCESRFSLGECIN